MRLQNLPKRMPAEVEASARSGRQPHQPSAHRSILEPISHGRPGFRAASTASCRRASHSRSDRTRCRCRHRLGHPFFSELRYRTVPFARLPKHCPNNIYRCATWTAKVKTICPTDSFHKHSRTCSALGLWPLVAVSDGLDRHCHS